ncbi:hypothetical protein VNO80_10685 [Phaseolus coccineus]|uniref:Uncharacterized protein n=1 Tax=Phaseolus coccineus TaxID=3886 RepID=A0AAN9RE26_PHACN
MVSDLSEHWSLLESIIAESREPLNTKIIMKRMSWKKRGRASSIKQCRMEQGCAAMGCLSAPRGVVGSPVGKPMYTVVS